MDEYYLNNRCRRVCNNHDWPVKHRTDIKDYRIWRQLLKQLCHDTCKTLIQPLGVWNYHNHEIWISEWDWFMVPDRSILYHRDINDIWKIHDLDTYSHYRYAIIGQLSDEPSMELIRVTTQISGHLIEIKNTALRTTSITNRDNLITFDAIQLSEPKVGWFNTLLTSSPTTSYLKECLINGSAVGVSDGSYFPIQEVGACGWIISTPDGGEWIEGGGVIPGLQSDQNSYRSELGGQLGIASFISSVNLPKGEYTLKTVCDGLSALNQVGLDKSYTKSSLKHVDMISMIAELWERSDFTLTKEHVLAHQDDLNRPLTMLEKLNCRMDAFAKDIARDEMYQPRTELITSTSVGMGTIKINDNLVTSRIQQSLYVHIMHSKFLSWYSRKYKIDQGVMENEVNWKAYKLARKESRLSMNIFMSKWLSEDTATGNVMVQRKQRISSCCPRCVHPEENTSHVLLCQGEGIIEHRQSSLEELYIWMKSVHTQPDIAYFIFKGLQSWLSSGSIIFNLDDTIDPSIFTACKYQLLVGWEAMLHGFISQRLVTCQQDHYSEMSSRKLGTRWGVQLIKRLWSLIHLHWTHRNSILHETEAIDLLSGVGQLTVAVINEYEQGLGELPSIYTNYFVSPLAFILQKPTAYLKQWFLVIRSGRESCSIELPTDQFSTDPALRSWIGLQPLS